MSNKVICLSGPSGAGKDYLLSGLDSNEYQIVQMYTTRPSRGVGDKPSISTTEMAELNSTGALLGFHVNATGFEYAYRIEDVMGAINSGKAVILEINPETQADLPEELTAKGIEFGGWVALSPDLEYIAENMILREHGSRLEKQGGRVPFYADRPSFDQILEIVGENNDITDIFTLGATYIGEDFTKRINMARTFLERYEDLKAKLTLFPVGWENRGSMAQEFSELLTSMSLGEGEIRKIN